MISTRDTVALLDPLAVTVTAPFADILHDSTITKIVHSAAEDVSLLAQITGVTPKGLFDTQIAAAFCGFGPSTSYRARPGTSRMSRTAHRKKPIAPWNSGPVTGSAS